MPVSNRREVIRGSAAAMIALAAPGSLSAATGPVLRSFRPGAEWRDTNGKPIQAHGGSILHVDGTFYWYGENKERTPRGGQPVWHWGMRCYSSRDLYNWEDRGVIIPPVLDDPASPLAPSSFADRPHIVYNQRTRKFVCWIKIMHPDLSQTRTVMTADRITGPYTTVRSGLKPFGMSAGDFDMVVAPDGKAYMIFERVHTEMIVADLTDDYTDFAGYYSTHLPEDNPPYTREGPGYFFRNGKHYMFTSGTTGYHPNPSMVHMAETYHGPWTTLGDAHPDDRTRTSYNSQICSVFKHPGKKDLYIALADRWFYNLPELEGAAFGSGAASRDFGHYYEMLFSPGGESKADRAKRDAVESQVEPSKARYVWLPVKFVEDRPYLDWRDEWSLDEFA